MIISQDWNAFHQSINLSLNEKSKFRLSAFVKTNNLQSESSAAIWVRVDNKDNSVGYFDNMSDRPIRNTNWIKVQLEGVINNNSERICFGGLCKYYGDFYFRDFSLEVESLNGSFENIHIINPTFCVGVSDIKDLGWKQGTGKKPSVEVEEYEIFLKSLTESDGNKYYIQVIGRNPFNINQYSKRIGQFILALDKVGKKLIRTIQDLSIDQLDYMPNNNCSSIGAYLMHLSGIEIYYQKIICEEKSLNNDEENKWAIAINLGKEANEEYQNLPIDYYLNIYRQTRARTLELFKSKNDDWLDKDSLLLDGTNLYHWLHVLEHQSYHFGQIIMLKKLVIHDNKKNSIVT